jgi:hypothetical protein
MKKMAVVVLCVVMLSMVVAVNESAATTANPDWYNCAIQSTGASGAFYFVFATCAGVGGTASWADSRVFLIDNAAGGQGKAMLAAVLTGYASSGAVALAFPGFGNADVPAGTFIGAAGAGSVS